jgi:hypothetical protein
MANRPNARAASDTQRAAPDPENSVEFCVKVRKGRREGGREGGKEGVVRSSYVCVCI